MSTEPDIDTACPGASDKHINEDRSTDTDNNTSVVCVKKRKKAGRNVSFPDLDKLVTQYFEPANPWQDGKFRYQLEIRIYIFNKIIRALEA